MKERTNPKPRWTARNIARRRSTAEFFEVEIDRVGWILCDDGRGLNYWALGLLDAAEGGAGQ